MAEIQSLPADFVLLDLGAGISCDVLDMFLASTEKVIVITPESLSLHNAFVFLKTVILHYLWRELEREEVLSTVRQNWGQMIDDREHLDIRSLIERVKVWDRYAAFVLAGLINELEIKFIVNRYRGGIENAHLRKFHRLLYKYLCVRSNISYLGFVHADRDVLASTQALVPFVLEYPENRAAKDLRKIANLLITGEVLDNTPQLQLPRETEPISLITHSAARAQPQAARDPVKHKVLGDPPPIQLSGSLKSSQ
jgi:flagellar biosynthesis protein FlhG